MIVAKLPFIRRIVAICSIVGLLSIPAYAIDLTWTGATSSLIFNSGSATGNWAPSDPTGEQATGENWIFPDAATLGAGSTTPSFDSGGALFVGGTSLGGITFQAGAPAYTFTQTDIANTFNLAGSTYTTASSTERGIITNDSTNKQTFNMDVISSRGTIDAKSGEIEFSAGRTFTTGGPADFTPVASTEPTASATQNANTFSTIFQGDHNIYLNSNVVQSVAGNVGTSGQRGLLLYRGASTPSSPSSAGALILGDLGAYGGRITVDSTNGGVVRATHNNSFGVYAGTSQSGTFVGSTTTGATSNGTVEFDGSDGNLTMAESFRLGVRTVDNGTTHLKNVAGNNTIDGFVSINFAGGTGSDSVFIESLAGGKLTITQGLGADRSGFVENLFLKGDGAIDLSGPDGLYTTNIATTTLNIDKSGNGTITTLAGTPNYYTGTTAIHAGSFIVNGTHATAGAGTYTVDASGTLGGNGSIAPSVNLSGTIAPGEVSTVGTFTVGGLSLTGGGILDFQLNSTNHTAGSTFNDLIIINNDGPLDLTGGATLNVAGVGGNLTAGDYDLIQFGGTTTVTGTTSNIALGTIPLGAGLSASIIFDADSVNLRIAAGLEGDFNNDGEVDAADYVVWRKTLGDNTNYNKWRTNFGTGSGAASVLSADASAPVPEPASALLMVFAITALCLGIAPRRRAIA
ncbi:MAG: hypothetical protein WD468_00485 [Pirellulales bacterium]